MRLQWKRFVWPALSFWKSLKPTECNLYGSKYANSTCKHIIAIHPFSGAASQFSGVSPSYASPPLLPPASGLAISMYFRCVADAQRFWGIGAPSFHPEPLRFITASGAPPPNRRPGFIFPVIGVCVCANYKIKG